MNKHDIAINSCKIGNIQINIKSNFTAVKRLDDVLYSIANVKIKEKLV